MLADDVAATSTGRGAVTPPPSPMSDGDSVVATESASAAGALKDSAERLEGPAGVASGGLAGAGGGAA